VLLFKFFKINIDSWFGLVVSIYIIINGIKLVKEASSPLIGEAPDKELVKNIMEKILNYEGVYGTHDFVIHNYGPGKIFATVHVEVDSQANILESHDLIDNIEREVSEELDILLTIHMDPIQTNDEDTNVLKNITFDAILNIDNSIRFHDFRIVKGTTHINVLFDIVVPPKYKMSDNEIKYIISKEVKLKCEEKMNTTVNVVLTVDRDYVI
jgi:divalent metal cation (Fe/Co/Zn/Cd) transporter